MHILRCTFRLSRVGLHLLQGIATVAIFYPYLTEARCFFLKQRWSTQLLKILGLHVQHEGELLLIHVNSM